MSVKKRILLIVCAVALLVCGAVGGYAGEKILKKTGLWDKIKGNTAETAPAVRVETVTLWDGEIPYENPDAETPNTMTAYLVQAKEPVPAIVIFAGGGYRERTPCEGAPMAEYYSSRGFSAFVVDYRVAPYQPPAPLADAERAIRVVRANAEKWGIDPGRVFACGFSAGGHLAASTAILDDVAKVGDALDGISPIPDGVILGYPVTSGLPSEIYTRSVESLLGDRYEAEKEDQTLYLHVDGDEPPFFIWHTALDDLVSSLHSLRLAEALTKNDVPYEMHFFPEGGHGTGLANGENGRPNIPGTARWAQLSIDWVKTFPTTVQIPVFTASQPKK